MRYPIRSFLVAILPIDVGQIFACTLQNLQQKPAVVDGDRLHAHTFCQVHVGELQSALVLDQRQRIFRVVKLSVEEAVLLSRKRRRSAANAIGLEMVAAFCLIGLLQIVELLRAIPELVESFEQLDIPVKGNSSTPSPKDPIFGMSASFCGSIAGGGSIAISSGSSSGGAGVCSSRSIDSWKGLPAHREADSAE